MKHLAAILLLVFILSACFSQAYSPQKIQYTPKDGVVVVINYSTIKK